MNISKAIDKAAGADRKKIATGTSGKTRSVLNAALHPETFGGGYDITIAATDDAKKWEGYGTALKPASEHWILCRKPIEEKTVVANVLKWGVGAINIDASRIGMINGDSTLRKRVGPTYTGTYNNGKVSEAQPGFMTGTDTGRFPANLLLSHSPGCKFVGEKEIKGNSPVGFSDVKTDNTYGKYAHNSRDVTHDLTETVQAYECVDGCPIAEMGEQSRYFKTFVYAGKSSKRDRNLGLTEGETSTHPTVKSQQLMTYLVKMITPPGGKVLDMFMGSGSTGVAAVNNGFKFVGIELDDDYYITAKTRIESAWEKSCNENTV
jgi:site-specific DNA-methyltransferase (adenine-specific)